MGRKGGEIERFTARFQIAAVADQPVKPIKAPVTQDANPQIFVLGRDFYTSDRAQLGVLVHNPRCHHRQPRGPWGGGVEGEGPARRGPDNLSTVVAVFSRHITEAERALLIGPPWVGVSVLVNERPPSRRQPTPTAQDEAKEGHGEGGERDRLTHGGASRS